MKKEMFMLWVILISILFLWTGTPLAQDKGVLPVDRFSEGVNENGIPRGWVLEKTPGPQSKISIEGEKGNYALRLLSVDDAFGVKKEMSFDINKFPFLSWKWKVTRLPQEGDIRKRETDDQAGQLYVVFPKFPATINSRSMGYIWDTHAPAGLAGVSTAYSKARYVVLESGAAKLNQWIPETRNVLEDYKKMFQEEPPQVGTVLLYINTQHTHGSAECFYADIYFSAARP